MRKYIVIALIVFVSGFQPAFSEGRLKVAVLDATLGNGVEVNASAIVADTINEQFVKSGKYIAIDRAYISKIQAEKKFQLSGEVNSDDVKELGALFGAQFICVANVSKLGSTYTVSARMIDVATAQIVSQESAKQKGEVDVLFDVAEKVGAKLVGKQYAAALPAQKEKPTAEKVVEEKTPPASVRNTEKAKPRPRLTVGYMFPGYKGANGDAGYWDSAYYALYDQDSSLIDSGLVSDAWKDAWGIDIESLVPMDFWYISGGFTYTEQSVGYTDFSYVDYEKTNFYTMEPYIGVGGIFSILDNLQIYGGVTLGYLMLTLGDYWKNVDESASGFSFGFEAGTDFFLGDFCLSLRYKLTYSADLTGDILFTNTDQNNGVDTSFGTGGLILSAGYGW